MPDLYRTISGALFRAPNLEHNNRDHIPWNAVQERADRNVILVNGTNEFTLEQVYDKLFQKSYEEWLAKERKKSRAKDDPPTYYEKIQKDKKKHLLDVWFDRTTAPSKFCVESTVDAEDEWLHSFFYFNDEIPSEADFEKTIGDYLTFEFSMIMQNREYLFSQGGEENAEP